MRAGWARSTNGCHLVGEVAKRCPAVVQQILEFDDRLFGVAATAEVNVDRTRVPCIGVDGKLRSRGPSAASSELDDKLLPTQVLEIAWQVAPGPCFDESGKLNLDGSRATCERLEGHGCRGTAFDPAP